MGEFVAPAFTDPRHPIGFRERDGALEVGWGGPGDVIRADLAALLDARALAVFIGELAGHQGGLPAMTGAKLDFLAGVLARRAERPGSGAGAASGQEGPVP